MGVGRGGVSVSYEQSTIYFQKELDLSKANVPDIRGGMGGGHPSYHSESTGAQYINAI